MAPRQVQKPQRSTYAPSAGSSTSHEDKARKPGRRKFPPSRNGPSQASRTRRQQRARLRLASSSRGSLPLQLDLASADASENTGARNGSASPQATGTTLVTGGTTIHNLNGTVTVNVSGFNAGSESPSSSSSRRTLSSPQTIPVPTPLSPSETYETIGDVYRRHMELRKKGRHALWTPQPYLQLSAEYRRGGTQVGDVGIITQEGAFDFMFNICGTIAQGSNELANLPVGFVPIHPPVIWEKEVAILAEHYTGDVLTRGVSRHILPRGEFIFTCTQPNGAILVLPNGSMTERLLNYTRFQKHYAQNAEEWYAFALATRGPDVRNGDLHLVYGCEKTTEWGIAAFDNSHCGEQLSEHRFRNMGEDWRNSTGTPYAWEHTDDAVSKVGPRDRELRELRASRDEPLRNQTLFIQSINITLREEDWKRITDTVSMDISMDSWSSGSSSANSISPGPSFSFAGHSSQSQTQLAPSSAGAASKSQHFSTFASRKRPAQILNEYLLSQCPAAKVAAIASEVWSHVEDDRLSTPDVLVASVLDVYSLVVVNNVASFVISTQRSVLPQPLAANVEITPLGHCLGPPSDIDELDSLCQSSRTLGEAPDDGTESATDVSLLYAVEMDDEAPCTTGPATHTETSKGKNTHPSQSAQGAPVMFSGTPLRLSSRWQQLSAEGVYTLVPVPAGWTQCRHPNGDIYFYNAELQVITPEDIRDPDMLEQITNARDENVICLEEHPIGRTLPDDLVQVIIEPTDEKFGITMFSESARASYTWDGSGTELVMRGRQDFYSHLAEYPTHRSHLPPEIEEEFIHDLNRAVAESAHSRVEFRFTTEELNQVRARFRDLTARRNRGENVTAMMSWLIGLVMPLEPVQRRPRGGAQQLNAVLGNTAF